MPERAPTRAELRQWEKFLRDTDRVGRKILANSARSMMATRLTQFATKRGIDIPAIDPADEKKLVQVANDWRNIKRAIAHVENYDLGLRFRDGEIDIMAPPNYTPEQIAAMNLSGWFIPIVVGIVVVGGIVIRMLQLDEENDRLQANYDAMIAASEKRICADPGSADCKAWQVEKTETDYNQKASLIDEIKNSLSSVGQTAKTGIGVGLAIAVPLIAWMVLRK